MKNVPKNVPMNVPVLRFATAAFAATAAALVVAGCDPAHGSNPAANGPPPAPVAIQNAKAETVPVTYEYVGQTAGSRDVEVRARVTGILLKRNFAEGGLVRAGQSLYTLDTAPFQAALQRADADVASAQAKLSQAQRNLARVTPLWDAKAASQRDFDDAVSAEQVARAELKRAEAAHTEAALNVSYAHVESPIGGLVSRSQVSEGTLVSGPQVLLTTVTQLDPIKVRFGIADTDQMRWRNEIAAGRLQLPAHDAFEIEVKLADGSVYPIKGKLRFSDTRVSGTTGTVEAEAEIPNPKGELKPGQFVRVRLIGAVRTNVVKLPTRAVLDSPQGKFVYVVVDGKAMPRPIEPGDQLSDGWIINSGVKAGEPVVIDGTARIFFPGAPVQLDQKKAT